MPATSPDSDLLLLARWCEGDARAGDALSRRHWGALQQFFRTKARAEDIDDLAQQVWVALGETRRRHGAHGVHSSFRAYLFGIARHVLFAHLRSRHRLTQVDPLEGSIAGLEPTLSRVVGERMEAERMMHALQRLPVDTQVLLELRYFNSMSLPELAALYEAPLGTIKSRLARGREALEAILKDA